MKHLIQWILYGLLLCIPAACTDDTWDELPTGNGVNPNRKARISLPVDLSQGLSANIVTRAAAGDARTVDSQVSGIMVFVYENKGQGAANDKLINWQLFGLSTDKPVEGQTGVLRPLDPAHPSKGFIDIFLPEGDVFIYLIANAKNSFVDFFWFQKQYDPNNLLQNRDLFIKSIVPKWNGNIDLVNGYLPMCGMVNNLDGACHVAVQVDANNPTNNRGVITYKDQAGTQHTISGDAPTGGFTPQNSIVLQRLLSKVTMHFKEGPGVKFKPISYQFHHCAEYISPIKGLWDAHTEKYASSVLNTESIPFDAQTPMDLEVYLPENIWAWPAGKPAPASFAEREAIEKDSQGNNVWETAVDTTQQARHQGHYLFKNAPRYATYVEVTGRLEQADQLSAEVRYLIHLGDFRNGQWQNYSLERDWHYTYNITVNGANDILVEVDKQGENPAVEGIVFQGGIRLELDSHFEQVEMRYLKNELNPNGDVFIYAETPYGKVHGKYRPGAPGKPGELVNDGSFVNVPATKEEMLKLLQWVEFKQQTQKGKLARYQTGTTKNIFEVLDEAYNLNSPTTYYTCFVDEYFYDRHPLTGSQAPGDFNLQQFINAAPRTFSIGSNIRYSADGQSAVANAVYMFKQRAIASFYDLNDRTRAKYGVELIDEVNLAYGAGTLLPYGNPTTEGTDVKRGRENTLSEISDLQTTPVVNWEKNGYLLNADHTRLLPGPDRLLAGHKHGFKACLIRNRDFNGNGFIDNHEIRWYTPARDQVLGLWIGEPAMPSEAALYPYPTTQLQRPAKGSTYPILSSSNGNNRVIWAEEGSTFGDAESAPNGGYIRVVRNLGTGNFQDPQNQKPHERPADPFYDYDPATRCITLQLTRNALRAYSDRELAPHHERSAVNRPPKKFQVAAHSYIKTVHETCPGDWLHRAHEQDLYILQTSTAQEAKNLTTTLAQQYPGDQEAPVSTADWRLPNQRELALMIVAMNQLYQPDPQTDWKYIVTDYKHRYNKWDPDLKQKKVVLHCRTAFSNTGYTPYGYMYNLAEKKMQMIYDDTPPWSVSNPNRYPVLGMGPNGIAGYLCVRDVR